MVAGKRRDGSRNRSFPHCPVSPCKKSGNDCKQERYQEVPSPGLGRFFAEALQILPVVSKAVSVWVTLVHFSQSLPFGPQPSEYLEAGDKV